MRILTAFTTAAALAASSVSAQPVTRVYNWSEYVAPDVLDSYTAETGSALVYDVYNEGAVAEARLVAGGTGYDVAVMSSEYLGRLVEAGALARLDRSRLKTAPLLDPATLALVDALHPDAFGATPFLQGFTGVGYDKAKIAERMPDAPLDSWAMIFDPEVVSRFSDCGVYILESPEEVVTAALAWLGRDPRSKDEADIEAALAAIRRIAPHVTSFSSEHRDMFDAGEICLALTWSTEIVDSDAPAAEWTLDFSLPREGPIAWFDLFVIPADAPDPEAAYRFIDHLLAPENLAENILYNYAAGPVPQAAEHLPEGARSHPLVAPSAELRARSLAPPPRDAEERAALLSLWTRAKLGF